MKWGIRKRIKIAPGIHVNISKSGISTSIGGKGLTYNSRGRITAGIPGTGIRVTKNIHAQRTSTPVRSVVSGCARVNSSGGSHLSKREQAALDFVDQVQDRTANALLQYFLSHGIYVLRSDLPEAVMLEEHQRFINTLAIEFEATTKAVKLAADIGTISLAEKEKAMLAVYEIERKCSDNLGDHAQLKNEAIALTAAIRSLPSAPSLSLPFVIGLAGTFFLFMGGSAIGVSLIVASFALGAFRIVRFIGRKAQVEEVIRTTDARFEAFLKVDISGRPVPPESRDNTRTRAIGLAAVVVVAAGFAWANRTTTVQQSVPSVQEAETMTPSASGKSTGVPQAEKGNPQTPRKTMARPSESQVDKAQNVVVPPIHQPLQTSFDCRKARSIAENLICSDEQLAKADIELAAMFARAKAAATDQGTFTTRARAAWTYRERACSDRECLLRWYADQSTVLRHIAETGDATAE